MGLTKLLIVPEKKGSRMQFDEKDQSRCIKAMFNPSRLTFSRTVRWGEQPAAKRDNPELQFTGADPSSLSIDLFFDTYDSPELTKTSVRQHTEKLRQLTLVDGGLHRPPICRLHWGGQGPFFQGVLVQIETQYTMFMEDGTPVRAINRCSFKQWKYNNDDLKEQDLLSSDVAKVWVVKHGQTLATIAAHEYGDPRQWRVIAEENGIDDPLAVVPGQRLVLPPRRVPWNRQVQP
jgi:nucleoid-associated protein YgaU